MENCLLLVNTASIRFPWLVAWFYARQINSVSYFAGTFAKMALLIQKLGLTGAVNVFPCYNSKLACIAIINGLRHFANTNTQTNIPLSLYISK